MAKVAFTGSFDPVHEGHAFVVNEAKRLGFDVVVIVANNADKKYSMDVYERARQASFTLTDVMVYPSNSDNIGRDAAMLGCISLVRGLRDMKDFEYEQKIAEWNLEHNGLPTLYIPCPPDLRHISSSAIRQNLTSEKSGVQ